MRSQPTHITGGEPAALARRAAALCAAFQAACVPARARPANPRERKPRAKHAGVYTDTFTINKGEYSFRFVPNGSSPEVLSITLNGENFDFFEDFRLESTSHQTGTSEYFTWKYDGQKIILISEMQEISIIINPNGSVMGSVSVDILEN